MPGLNSKNVQFCNVSSSHTSFSGSSNGIWSKHREDVTFDQLQKFWSELPPTARQELLRIDKQTLFEQARKNLYCSRCNGLLLEGFSQIVMYGKSLQQEGCQDDAHDPSVHPWGGLATTRDGILTLLDCFLDGKSLKELQNVFDSARARERERELLYPDACGGGGRGWISQGMPNYGRGHGTRETCALHTARLSCDTLVDFWSALGDETRSSLLRMKEEDFMERLMYRFDSKRFCRDCRRNVIREFKELKELKRMRKEPRCTSWFCVADTAFQYEVSCDTIQADWHQSFKEMSDTYHHFEWAVGTGEGKSDILGFEDVGANGNVQADGLDLGGLNACFITLRAWRIDGRCTEISVKAHALKGQQCVHRRLVVGDGFVTITKGESIRRFFEHAEEAEEEEDDESMDKDGNELDGDGSRPQKHAKSPELAREFLLDAATVIFKEQVEKAFREGTARQNAHSIFVSLALKLLEERVHVACKEIITLEKQIKLLEEEEKEKRDEEERKERRRTREREKKLRRKEKLKGKEREREKIVDLKQVSVVTQVFTNKSSNSQEELLHTPKISDPVCENGDIKLAVADEQPASGCTDLKSQDLKSESFQPSCNFELELNARDGNGDFMIEQSKSSRRKLKFRKEPLLVLDSKWCGRRRSIVGNEGDEKIVESEQNLNGYVGASSRYINGVHMQTRKNISRSTTGINSSKFNEKFHCSGNRIHDRYNSLSCRCKIRCDYRAKDGPHSSMLRPSGEIKIANKSESSLDVSRPFNHGIKYNNGCCIPNGCRIPRSKFGAGNNPNRVDFPHVKKVWEPTESRKKYRSHSDTNDSVRSALNSLPDDQCSLIIGSLTNGDSSNDYQGQDGSEQNPNKPLDVLDSCQNGFVPAQSRHYTKDSTDGEATSNGYDPITSTSSSDNCSSCLSEVDGSTSSLSTQNTESLSTSDSEDASQQSEAREVSIEARTDGECNINARDSFTSRIDNGSNGLEGKFPVDLPAKKHHCFDSGRIEVGPEQNHMLPVPNQSMHFPVFPSHSLTGYYHQSPDSWAVPPANGLVPFPESNPYIFSNPFGYGLSPNRSSHLCMQYGSLQPLITPVINVEQVPLYPTVKDNGLDSKDQTKNLKSGIKLPEKSVHEHLPERSFPNGWFSSAASQPGQDANFGNSHSKFNHDNPNFSLFHFSGPVAVAAGYNWYPVPLKEETTGNFPSKLQETSVKVDLAHSKKETSVEEYSLFAANNGTMFTFF